MSLIVNLQVTQSQHNLEQIHNLVITNVSLVEPMRGKETPYTAFLDGVVLPELVYHNRDNGALELLEHVLKKFRALGWYDD